MYMQAILGLRRKYFISFVLVAVTLCVPILLFYIRFMFDQPLRGESGLAVMLLFPYTIAGFPWSIIFDQHFFSRIEDGVLVFGGLQLLVLVVLPFLLNLYLLFLLVQHILSGSKDSARNIPQDSNQSLGVPRSLWMLLFALLGFWILYGFLSPALCRQNCTGEIVPVTPPIIRP